MPSFEESEAIQPTQNIMPRWLNNVFGIYVGYIISSTTGRNSKFHSSSDSICSGSSKPSNQNKSSVCISSGCNMAKYTRIFGIGLCNSSVLLDLLHGVKDISTIRSVPCTYLCMIMIMRGTALWK